jgi:NADPH:quinone reductase-like Zn-dependent oxidoreductase
MMSSPATMRAVRLCPRPGGQPAADHAPAPARADGWVRIRVEAFGLSRSELKLRLGLSVGVSFPRVPGIEAAGTVDAFQEILDAVAAGRLAFPVDRVYDGLEQVPRAHDDMEHDRATGKLVVRVRH